MKLRNNRCLIVIPALVRISRHDPTPPRTQQSEGLNHITIRRVDEIRVNVWLIREDANRRLWRSLCSVYWLCSVLLDSQLAKKSATTTEAMTVTISL
jgi:hypothetical protein